MPTVHELLDANLHEVFGNRDADVRRAAAERIYSPDVVLVDPEGENDGREALLAKAAELLGQVPDSFVFAADGPHYASEDTGALAWALGPAGAPQVRGIDVVTVADGRITQVRTFFLSA
ncbi:nuclear transport factor 2 family protein [Curtobacterium sp. 458]|uniref:nuclear transport factor 2 family protein n=1 Tax=Curtobacterium sp. 458 TaxID=3050069 RepID=UPI0025B5E818|nr:nuclear transport factor 2 family protein [Curtobacterium sp. 458]WJY01698.1 nuclear transport factor 2 family protein [Curtobacterium sp. 458]